MKCKYKELFEKDAECGLTYPECMKYVLCAYEDKYHERLLEKENVSENYTKEGDREWHPHIDFIIQALVQVPAERIEEAPSIDIVRCKECKYERDGEEFMWCEHPNGLDSIVKPDDFCSYGEREESE